jgi:ferredoxin
MTDDDAPSGSEFTFGSGAEPVAGEDAPAEEATADDTPAEEAPADDAPAEEATGDAVVGPARTLDPGDAVRVQLDAIEAASVDASAARAAGGVPGSVRTLFDFAAPSFRAAHGDLEGFAAAMLGPIYDRLVGARRVERGASERDDDRYVQAVLARHPDGDRTYEFVLARQRGGKYDGCWLTESVDLTYDGASPSFRRTPTVTFGGRTVTCEVGDQLRAVLLSAEGYSPHNDVTQVANCGGNGLCGTCAVSCDGDVDEMADRERQRLSLPPHDAESGLRLACQTHVQGDVVVEKHDGYWGQHVADAAGDDEAGTGGSGNGPVVDPASVVEVTDAEYAGEYDYDADRPGGASHGAGGAPSDGGDGR